MLKFDKIRARVLAWQNEGRAPAIDEDENGEPENEPTSVGGDVVKRQGSLYALETGQDALQFLTTNRLSPVLVNLTRDGWRVARAVGMFSIKEDLVTTLQWSDGLQELDFTCDIVTTALAEAAYALQALLQHLRDR